MLLGMTSAHPDGSKGSDLIGLDSPSSHFVARPSVGMARSSTASDARWLTAERGVAVATLILFGIRKTVGLGLSPGYIAALALAPVWVGVVRRYWGGRLLFFAGAGALVSGVVLSRFSSGSHAVTFSEYSANIGQMLGLFGGVGVILWARTILSAAHIGIWFGIGMAITALTKEGALTPDNPLKFGWSLTIAVILLSVVNQSGRIGRQLIAMVGLAILCAASDFRSLFGVCLVSAVLLAWQMRSASLSRRKSWLLTTTMMGGLGVGMYFAGTALLVDGYLGAQAQARSILQIQTAGSLILGGRPELAASAALFAYQPSGFGIGVVPNAADLAVAKAGMAKVNYNPDNGYVERYMFGTKFELHSTTGDMWAFYGLVGLVLAAVIALVVLRGLAIALSGRSASGLLLLLGWWTAWNLLFSPLLSAAPSLTLILGLVLVPRAEERGGGGSIHGGSVDAGAGRPDSLRRTRPDKPVNMAHADATANVTA